MTTLKKAMVLAATLVAMAIGGGNGVAQDAQDWNKYIAEMSPLELNLTLEVMAREMNKGLPKMVNPITRLDKATPGDGEFTYHYTVTNSASLGDRSIREVLQENTDILAKALCADSNWRQILNKGVTTNFSYTGPDGKPAADIKVTSADGK